MLLLPFIYYFGEEAEADPGKINPAKVIFPWLKKKKKTASRIYGWIWKSTAGLGENPSKILQKLILSEENGNIERHYLVVRKPQGCQFFEFGKSEGQILQPVKENIGTKGKSSTSKIIS